jgi:immune inhibitor A
LIGWANPVELDYSTTPRNVKVGQLSQRPKKGTKQGIKINLPDQVIETPNPLGTGQAWWSDRADLADFYLAHDFDLTGATAPVFSFASYWSFEEDYDYGYVEVSEDGGATWLILPDMDGYFEDDGLGNWGLNGEDMGTLRFDLAAFAGKMITLRLHYTSDVGVQWAGWWADDFLLEDGAATLFSDDVESPPGGWTTNNFVIVPLTRIYPLYYLAEWRNDSGFDRGLKYPYQSVYYDEDEWEVDRCPYTVPGMLLWLRNGAQDFDYTLYNSLYDPPSYGPKHALLVVDSHFWPLEWEGMGTTDAHLRLGSRCQPGNATFTLQETTPFTVRRVDSIYAGNVLETKTFTPLPAVSQFHDSVGYYPGLRYRPANDGLYFWDAAASLVVPAQDNYTTKITWGDKSPLTDFYGFDMGDTILGSGNPGDAGVQYGLHMAVIDKDVNGTWGIIKVWNSPLLVDLEKYVRTTKARSGGFVKYTLQVVNRSPITQSFAVDDPIPENTTYVRGMYYDPVNNRIYWTGQLEPGQTRSLNFWVKINEGIDVGSEIKNEAVLMDDALGDKASTTTTVVIPKEAYADDFLFEGDVLFLPLMLH